VSTFATRIPAAFGQLSRRRDDRLVAGVCSGLADSARVDPTLVRLVFALLALAGGAGILAYGGAWLALPVEGGEPEPRWRRLLGAGALLTALGFALRSVGLVDTFLWAAVLVVAGAVIIESGGRHGPRRKRQRRLIGTTLIVLAAALFAGLITGVDSQSNFLAPAGLVVLLCLVVGPWIWRIAQERDAERLARIRAQERADVAARVHDSVLQTLALVQKSADDPKRVAALARRQERELRGWLYGARADAVETLSAALEDALADVEELHGVRVELVQTGDAPLDDRSEALVLAAREALTNAATHGGVGEVSVFVEVGDREIAVWVRDRGRGFDPAAVTADRRGVAESIEGRLERSGGTAAVRSAPGEGTEVELRLPLEASS